MNISNAGLTIGLVVAAVIMIVIVIATQGTVLNETNIAQTVGSNDPFRNNIQGIYTSYASEVPLVSLISNFWPVLFALIPLTLAAASSGLLSNAIDRLR